MINKQTKLERMMKKLVFLCILAFSILTLKSEEKKPQITISDSTNIVLANKALREVIDEYVSGLAFEKEKYIICLQLKRVEDTYIIQIGPHILNAGSIFYQPPSSVVTYDNKVLFIYTGFEEFFYFSEQYKDSLAQEYFPEQYKEYKELGFIQPISNEEDSWMVKIRDDKVIWWIKFVIEPVYWK